MKRAVDHDKVLTSYKESKTRQTGREKNDLECDFDTFCQWHINGNVTGHEA